MNVPSAPRSALTCTVLLIGALAGATASAGPFEEGVAAFQQGHYAQALESFETARQAGLDEARLDYNLGSTYYRLGRLDAARQAFLRAARSNGFSALSHYNLGLIALRQDRPEQAGDWFRRALGETDDPRIRRLCRIALGRIGGTDDAPRPGTDWTGFASIDLGYDDNVTLQPDTQLLTASRQDDSFVDVYAFVDRRLPARDWRVDASLFVQKYASLSRFDTLSLDLGIGLDHRYGWGFAGHTELSTGLTMLDDRGFTATTTLATRGTRRLPGDGRLRLAYELAQIDALDPRYGYLTGRRQRLEIRPRWRWPNGLRLGLGYRYEINDRKDRPTPLFTSFSARRHRLRIDASMRLGRRYELAASTYYRASRYRDPNRTNTGGEITRSEGRWRLRLSLTRRLSSGRELGLSVQHTRNDSNIARYAYENNQAMVSLLIPW